MIKKILTVALIIIAWDNRQVIADFLVDCWNEGIDISSVQEHI